MDGQTYSSNDGFNWEVKSTPIKSAKCSLFREALSSSTWMSGSASSKQLSSSETGPPFDQVISLLTDHLNGYCSCVTRNNIQLLIANAYYHMFIHKRRYYAAMIIKEENLLIKACSKEDTEDNISTTPPVSNPDADRPSKLQSDSLPSLVGFTTLQEIVDPLVKAIQYWKEAAKRPSSMDINLIWKLQLVNNISVAFYTFNLHKMVQQQQDCGSLLLVIGQLTKKDHPEVILSAYYFQAKFLINVNCIELAKAYLQKAESYSFTLKKLKKQETYETYLIALLKLEMDLLSGKGKKSGKKLMDYIESDYLQRLSLNRFYLKGMAFLLASQYSVNEYTFSSNFKEFLEPVQMSISILKRWHRDIFPSGRDKQSKADPTTENDPLWYRMAIYDFSFKSFMVAAKFYINMSLPHDLSYVYNSLLKIARENCCVSWLAKLLIVGADIDCICDKKSYSFLKLNNASLVFNPAVSYSRRLSNLSTFSIPKESCKSLLSSNELESSFFDLNFSPTKENNPCAHSAGLSIQEIRRKLMIEQNSSEDFDNDEVFIDSQLSMGSPIALIGDAFDVGMLRLEIIFSLHRLKNDRRRTSLEQMEYYYYTLLPKVNINFISQFQDIINNENIENNLSKFFDELRLKMANYIVQLYITFDEYQKGLDFLLEMFGKINFKTVQSFEEQSLIADILFKFVIIKLKLMKLNSVLFKYDARSAEESLNAHLHDECPSPTLASSRKPPKALPKAPKLKNAYKSEEFKEYIDTLADIVYNQNQSMKRFKAQNPKKSEDFESNFAKKSVTLNQSPEKYKSTKGILSERFNTSSNSNSPKPRTKSLILNRTADKSKKSVRRGRSRTVASEFSRSDKDTSLDELSTAMLNNIIFANAKSSPEVEYEEFGIQLPCLSEISSLKDLKSFIFTLACLLGNHPSTKLYLGLHEILFKMSISTYTTDIWNAAYHFAETNSAALRYRTQLTYERKKRSKIPFKFDMKDFNFNPLNDYKSENLQSMLNELPSTWRIVQIHHVKKSTIPDLVICRYQKNKPPIFLHIVGNESKFPTDFMTEFYEIIDLSNVSITNKDPKTFWKVRFSLDKRLEILLKSLDDAWFGPFKGILMGEVNDEVFQNLCSQMKIQVAKITKKFGLSCINNDLLDVIIESFPVITHYQFTQALAILFNDFSSTWLAECYQKCELLFSENYSLKEKQTLFKNFKLEPVGLILNKPLESFPFESIPMLHQCEQSYFRIPSLRFLSCLLKSFRDENSLLNKGVNQKKTYYVLNPSDNLAKTENYFKDLFEREQSWKGVVGNPPDPKDLKSALETKDLYIFFGHGAGSCYYGKLPEGLDGVSLHSASLVIGCCSGKLYADGNSLESHGMPYRFLINGSPCYVGVLWDVTDRDIDKFSDNLLRTWLPKWKDNESNEETTIDKAVAKSRNACKLKYLIGASPIVYGLPLWAMNEVL